MKADKNTIRYIAGLAKLKFTENEADEFAAEFEKILGHFENIEKEDLAGFDLNPEFGESSVLRKDEVKSFEDRQELFKNARETRDGSIVIPKVLE
jgi:aspartyl-tRNA(Asn)/glutamyl-tRNA(Gln) amidotransferase subunit C